MPWPGADSSSRVPRCNRASVASSGIPGPSSSTVNRNPPSAFTGRIVSETFESHHYAFQVSDEEFDDIFGRIEEDKVVYGSLPNSQEDMQINNRRGGRGLYFKDANGHSWEILTHPA